MGVFAFAYLAVYHPLCLVFCSAWRGLPAQQSHGVATGSWRRQVGVSSSGAADASYNVHPFCPRGLSPPVSPARDIKGFPVSRLPPAFTGRLMYLIAFSFFNVL